ncbi:UNVERIFIED_CONTAM: hypothetical protein GTU68_039468, partial [Idotea baltica]|nr:hypothetical protein [Idotea baltica]
MAVALAHGFDFEGYRVRSAGDGVEALASVNGSQPDLIILDVMLPKIDGLEVCRRLRAAGNDVPIIMLTARGQEVDKILGLKLGADDYVTKPFSLLELLTRAEALLRRSQGQVAGADFEDEFGDLHQIGDVQVDFKGHRATKRDEELDLTARELRLLEFLLRRRGQVVTR